MVTFNRNWGTFKRCKQQNILVVQQNTLFYSILRKISLNIYFFKRTENMISVFIKLTSAPFLCILCFSTWCKKQPEYQDIFASFFELKGFKVAQMQSDLTAKCLE